MNKKIIENLLEKYPYTFYAFGSRAKKTSKKFSDLDLCYLEKIPDNIILYDSHNDRFFCFNASKSEMSYSERKHSTKNKTGCLF